MKIPAAYKRGLLNVVIETPKGSNFKYNYDHEFKLLRLAKALPAGMHFPYDFGFIPSTLSEDGDPLDILVLSPYPLVAGCLAAVQIIGVLEAHQTEKNSRKPLRNDRLIGCLHTKTGDEATDYNHVKDLPLQWRDEVEAFFIHYNQLAGKRFKPLGWYGPKRALSVLNKSIQAHKS